MTTGDKNYPPQQRRWLATFMLALTAVTAARIYLGEPAFVQGWSAEVKAVGLFVLAATVFLLSPLVVEALSRRIDPIGYGALAKRPLKVFLEAVGVQLIAALSVVLPAYGKEVDRTVFWWAFFCLVAIALACLFATTFVQASGDGKRS
jgi:hypothetical protein